MRTPRRTELRVWTCPICFDRSIGVGKPPGWLIVEPFTRVVCCDLCRPALERREALQRMGLDA